MKRSLRSIASSILGVGILATGASTAFAQSDLNVFGFFQGQAVQTFTDRTDLSRSTVPVSENMSRFLLQQANIFAQKEFGNGWSAFLNLEMVNNYSSDRGWGSLNLQEAFVKYEGSDAFKVKAGLFLPQFGNLYEIYNRMPLLPYLSRPYVYDPSFSSLVPSRQFLPQRALAQIYGFVPVGSVNLDYAVYVGNAEDAYIASSNNVRPGSLDVPGWSTTSLKTIGTRVGARVSTLKAGVSVVADSYKMTGIRTGSTGADTTIAIGDIPRMRIGLDLSYSIAGFTLMGEYIMTSFSPNDAQKQLINERSRSNPLASDNLSKTFYYATLQYDVMDNLFTYAMINSFEDKYSPVFSDPLLRYSIGAGYRPIDDVVIKVQLNQAKIDSPLYKYDSKSIEGGVSVAF